VLHLRVYCKTVWHLLSKERLVIIGTLRDEGLDFQSWQSCYLLNGVRNVSKRHAVKVTATDCQVSLTASCYCLSF
jgi:hypothetical protein